jgi:hypothetical protein
MSRKTEESHKTFQHSPFTTGIRNEYLKTASQILYFSENSMNKPVLKMRGRMLSIREFRIVSYARLLSKNFKIFSATRFEQSAGGPVICYLNFETVKFPCFLLYSFPVLHVIE